MATFDEVTMSVRSRGLGRRHYVVPGAEVTLCGLAVPPTSMARGTDLCANCERWMMRQVRPLPLPPPLPPGTGRLDVPDPPFRGVSTVCPDCGGSKSARALRCVRCKGAAQRAAWTPPPRMLCPLCGARKGKTARVCWACSRAGR